jgi:hypothetical protein
MCIEREILQTEYRSVLAQDPLHYLGERGFAAIIATDDNRRPLFQEQVDIVQQAKVFHLYSF